MANKDDKYIAEVMAQKKALGIDCPAIDSIEIVEINGYKEETDMATDMEQRIMAFMEQMKEDIEDYYDALDDPDHTTPMVRRYIARKSGQLKGMCRAFELLTGNRIEYGREGIKLIMKEVE